MPQDNNQPTAAKSETPRLEGWPLENFSYITDSLKGFKFGEAYNNEIYDAMAKGLPKFEISRDFNLPQFEGVRDVNMSIPKEPVRYNLRFDQIDTESGKMHVLSQIDASLLKEGKADVSATFRVFQKTGFNAIQMRNLLQGRTVAHNRRSMRTGKPYLAYTKLDLTASKDEYGNTQLNSVPAFRQDYDAAKLLGKVLPNNYTQQDIENVGRRLDNGDIVPIAKRGAGGNLDVFHLFAAPQDDALMAVDKNGEVRKYTAPTMEVIRGQDQTTGQQQQQGKSNNASGDDKLNKAAQAAQQMEGAQNNPTGARQRPRAA
jgi:hypothetical protein